MKTFIQLVVACLLSQVISAHTINNNTVPGAPNTWTQKTDFAGGVREYMARFTIGSKAYIGCGNDGVNQFKDFWEYDPATDKWTRKADFPGAARSGAVGFAVGNKGYLGSGQGNYYGPYYNDFWEYDPATNTWTSVADFPGVARFGGAAFSIGSKGYFGSGVTTSSGDIFYSDFWEYDPASNKWTRKADCAGGGRNGSGSFSIGNKGYVGCGFNWSYGGTTKDFWEYDPATDKWTRKADFGGSAREYNGQIGFSIGDKGYIGTGEGGGLNRDFWEYNPATNKWTRMADVGGNGRCRAVGFSIGNKGYIGTGWQGNKDFWEYTPECAGGITVYADTDGDGYGDVANSLFVTDCILPGGYVYNSADCNDNNGAINPNALEIIGDGIDNNCNGVIDELINNGLHFDGMDDYVDCGNPLSLQIDNQITVELWVKPEAGGRIIGKYADQLGTGWRIWYTEERFVFGVTDGNDHDLYSTVSSAANQWHHVSGTYNKSTGNLRIYVDGVMTEETGYTDAHLLNTRDNMNIGRFKAYGISYAKITVDEVRIWNIERTREQIHSDMLGGLCGDTSTLVAYYAFNQGIAGGNNEGATILNDASSKKNRGRLFNFSLTGSTSNWVAGVSGLKETEVLYQDADGDGFGNINIKVIAPVCESPEGFVTDSTDCNDANAAINTDAKEILGDGIDNNCNGIVDENVNNSLIFDGINDYVNIPYAEPLTLNNGSFTVEFWAKPSIVDASFHWVVSKDNGNEDLDYLIGQNWNSKWRFNARNLAIDISSTTSAAVGAYQHIAGTFDGTTAKLYINGVLENSTTSIGTAVSNTSNVLIGGRWFSSPLQFFQGEIDEVRIWNVARTQAEIQANMHVRICSTANGLVAYYPLNQGIPGGNNAGITVADDVTANNNDGTLNNFALTGLTSNWVEGVPGLSDTATFYQDADGDGYGNPGVSIIAPACEPPAGYVLDNTDCNDANSSINPGAPEICGNRIDDNCNGTIDEGCMVITNVTNINSSQATIHWKAVPNASSFRLRSCPAGTTNYKYYGYETPVTDTFKTITNLLPVTQYNIQVMALFAGGTDSSDWSAPYSFTTQGYCNPPTGLQVGTVTSTSAKLLWSSPVSAVSHYELRIRRNGAPEWTVRPIQPATESITINGLRPGTQYQWQLRSGCINITDKSIWAKGPLFTTTGTAVTANSSASFTAGNTTATLLVSPNPNKGQFTIQAQLPGKALPTTVILYNSLGAKVWQYTAGSISGQWHSTVELENKLTPGMYTLMLQRSDIKLVQKVLISK